MGDLRGPGEMEWGNGWYVMEHREDEDGDP